MICPLRINGSSDFDMSMHPSDFECRPECAWLVIDRMANGMYSGTCAVADSRSGGRGVNSVDVTEYVKSVSER